MAGAKERLSFLNRATREAPDLRPGRSATAAVWRLSSTSTTDASSDRRLSMGLHGQCNAFWFSARLHELAIHFAQHCIDLVRTQVHQALKQIQPSIARRLALL